MPGVVVTGGAGFIGSHIVDELIMHGHDVLVIDDLSEGKMDNLMKDASGRLHPKITFLKADIASDAYLLKRAFDNREWVFHLAAMSRIQPSITDPTGAMTKNVMGTTNVLEAARAAGIKRVVYSASSSAYGNRNSPPMKEDMRTDCLNPYSLSKKVGEELMDLYRDLYGMSTVSLRYFNVYGPRHQEEGSYATVIAIFLKQKRYGHPMTVVGDGEQRRDFTFVGDVVKANMLAAMNRDATGTLNIGYGKNFSINEVASLIGGSTVFIPPRLGEARLTLADNTKAYDVLGWKPSVDLENGIKVTMKYDELYPRSGIVISKV